MQPKDSERKELKDLIRTQVMSAKGAQTVRIRDFRRQDAPGSRYPLSCRDSWR